MPEIRTGDGVSTERDHDRVRVEETPRGVVAEERTTTRPFGAVRREYDVDHDVDVAIPKHLNYSRDRVRWGPVWAGFFTAMTTLVLLGLLGLAVGLTTINAGTAAATGGPPPATGTAAVIWGVISLIIAFLLGGYVAGRTASVFSRGWAAFNGLMVFLLALPLMLWLASQGLSSVLGTVGNFASALSVGTGSVQNAANQAANSTSPADIARAASTARDAAWGALIGAILALIASTLGGMWGTRRTIEVDTTTRV